MIKAIREICIAGKVIDVCLRPKAGNHKNKRAPKTKVTSEDVQRVNDRDAAKRLARLLNANMDDTCWHYTLTYKNQPSLKEAYAIEKNFIRRLSYRLKKLGIKFKWVTTVEYKATRIHHHLITNIDPKFIEEAWQLGHIFRTGLYSEPDYTQLAEYIIKETSKTFRQPDCPFKTRFSRSRNLIVPEVRIEEVEPSMLLKDPVPWKGYEMLDEPITWENPITGLKHIEYKMVAVGDPRLKKYYKGRVKTRKESYWRYINSVEEQLSFGYPEADFEFEKWRTI